MNDPLKFVVAPHIVQDLGLNLYTDLPRVLVEYVANAHDADSPHVDVKLDLDAIVVEDTGHGMSRDELQNKFLVAGRRRRQAEPEAGGKTEGLRPLMGRKGLGKLAGFGVAKRVEVVTRRSGESHATRIVLAYEDLARHGGTGGVTVPDERLEDGGGFESQGTRIVLSRLLYDPLRSRPGTIRNEIAEHFELVRPDDFAIRMNGQLVKPLSRQHAYAWPDPTTPVAETIEKILPTEAGEIRFSYRIRFVPDRQALSAARRGVRVYVGRRLAAAPSLLDADTNMHGFRMTDYMDGVVQADFIDDQSVDYIATDRQSLRWETPLLGPMKKFLSDEIKEACKGYQKVRDENARSRVKKDSWTTDLIDGQGFSKADNNLAYRMAALVSSACKQNVDDPVYKEKLPVLIKAIGHGNLFAEINKLSGLERPDLEQIVVQITRLTRHELDNFVSYAKTRLTSIATLRRIVESVDFKAKRNEKLLQKLFERNPWILDPTFTQFLTADQPQSTVFRRLAKELEIGEHAPSLKPKSKKPKKSKKSEEDDRCPDLVFLIGSLSLQRLIVVELKSANLPQGLTPEHLNQLKYYMERAEQWLADQERPLKVEGYLIGTKPKTKSTAPGAVVLRGEMKKAGPNTPWRIRDYLEVLVDTEAAHNELLKVNQDVHQEDD
jgi:hypothetical protein